MLYGAAALGPEAYRIDFDGAAITVTASAHAGFLYGFITLGQILLHLQMLREEGGRHG